MRTGAGVRLDLPFVGCWRFIVLGAPFVGVGDGGVLSTYVRKGGELYLGL